MLHKALNAYRCTNRADSFSPFQMFFGQMGKSLLLALQAALYPVDPDSATEVRCHFTEKRTSASADRRRKCIFHPGDLIFVQDPIGGTWTRGRVKEANGTGSYIVEFEDGACKSRNEKYLCLPKKSTRSPESVKSDPPSADHAPITHPNSPSVPVPPEPVSPCWSTRLAKFALILALSLLAPTMMGFGFSPNVSTNCITSITHHHNCPTPLYSTILMC